MSLKIISLNARGLNKTTKRRQIFRWLHQQKSDVIFLQETYSSPKTINLWEAEWGGKIFASHGSTHSRGVMILFKPRLDVTIDKIIPDKNGRYILAETLVDGSKLVFLNIYAPNDQTQQVRFLRDLSTSVLNQAVNEKVILGGDFNCALSNIDKSGGRSFECKKAVIKEINELTNTFELKDMWRQKNPNDPGFTWSNASLKIRCRLDYFFASQNTVHLISECQIIPNIFSDHSAIQLYINAEEKETRRGPGFWKFNNSLLTDKDYIELVTKSIPAFVSKYKDLVDKGLFWEMIKMEIRSITISFAKRKAKQKRVEERELSQRFTNLQEQLRQNFDNNVKTEMDRVKSKLKKIIANKTQGSMLRSKARWYEFGEKNNKYFYNLEKRNHKKKHITTLTSENDTIISDPKLILEEEANFYKNIYKSKQTNPEDKTFASLFESEGLTPLDSCEADQCEGLLTLDECAKAICSFQNDKTPGSDGFTVEFYRLFWHLLGQIMVDSFNHAFETGRMSISQKFGIISLIPKKDKDLKFLKNWRPITLLNTDYKIATKAIALRLEKVLPKIIHPCQAGYMKGRYIGECIRMISDIMTYTKQKNMPGAAVFLDFEKAFDSIEWNYLQKCLETFKFGPQLRQWVNVFYKDISSCVLNNGFASEHFTLSRGVRQGCPLSGLLFIIGIEILGNAIRHSKTIKGIDVTPNKTAKLAQYADDTTIFVQDDQSIINLFNLLDKFERVSGLRINQSKSELLWLGSSCQRKDKILNLRLSEEPIYALGIYFSYDLKKANEKNFYEKLGTLKKILNIWSSRDISIYGKINIVKTLALSKLTFVCSVLDTPESFAEEVNKIIFSFIWKYKQPKIKKSTILKCKEEGGLNMTDFTVFDKALKICWVKRLCATADAPWKAIPNYLLSDVGGTLIFQCNYKTNCLVLNKSLPKFYKDVIAYWQELVQNVPKTKNDVINQIIWNNQFIKINNVSVFYKNWYQNGVRYISCLLNDQKSGFLNMRSFQRKYQLKCNFLQYYGLLSAIPRTWKELLKSQNEEVSSSPPPIEKLTCKIIYNLLIQHKNLPPPTAEKRLLMCGFDPAQRRKVYSLPFSVTKETKLSVFQFKIIHNILSTNSLLYKMKIVDSPDCPFCPDIKQTASHLFVHCPRAVSFWNDFIKSYSQQCKKHNATTLSENQILYGVLESSSPLQTLNHLILIGKYFLFICAKNNKIYQFADFADSVREKMDLEKYIAIRQNNLNKFNSKWKDFI